MTPSDRLPELRRQRAMIQDHLTWLDHEIAVAERAAPGPVDPGAAIPPVKSDGPRSTADAATERDADAILGEYRTRPSDLQREVRRGCLLYFAGAFALLAAIVAALYFGLRH